MFARLLRALRPARKRKPLSRRPRSCVPRIEVLEVRDVLSTLLVSGLEGSQGSTVGPGGDLYVTESAAGRVARVDPESGAVATFASGLPIGSSGFAGEGAVDVAFIGRTAYVLVTLFGPPASGPDVIGIYRVDGPDSFTVIADIGAWSVANPPETEFELATGVQYALEPFRGGFLVTDGHHNRVLQVKLDGEVTELMAFDNIVPTGLEVRGNTVYMAEAGPVPHLPEDGKIVAFKPRSTTAQEVASGAPLLVDVEFGRGDTLFALSQGDWDSEFPGDPAQPDTGALVRVNRNGTFTVIEDGLDRPTSLEFIGNIAFVVSLNGEISKIDVSPPTISISDAAGAVAEDGDERIPVAGAGQAVITDPDGNQFSGNRFALAGVLGPDGSAKGRVAFQLGEDFSNVWGAVPGATDSIRLTGRITQGEVTADGTVILRGTLLEEDYLDGELIASFEDEPFEIVIDPSGEDFVLQWCLLPAFGMEVTRGHIVRGQ